MTDPLTTVHKFSKISDARETLIKSGFSFAGHGLISKTCETWQSTFGFTAVLRKVPFQGYTVRFFGPNAATI